MTSIIRDIEKRIARSEKRSARFSRRVKKSPIYRLGNNLKDSLNREILGGI